MRYAMVSSAIWNDEKFKLLSEDERILLLYLITCPHGNMIGLFTLKDGYACEDLGWEPKRYQDSISKLTKSSFVSYDKEQKVVLIRKLLKTDPIEDHKRIVNGAVKQFKMVPDTKLKQELLSILEENRGWGNDLLIASLMTLVGPSKGLHRSKVGRPTSVTVTVPVTVTESVSVTDNGAPAIAGQAPPDVRQTHQVVIDRFLELKGISHSDKSVVSAWYKRHSRSALALIQESGGVEHAVKALEWGAELFDQKQLTWTLDTIAKHLPEFARYGEDDALAKKNGLTRHQVKQFRELAEWAAKGDAEDELREKLKNEKG